MAVCDLVLFVERVLCSLFLACVFFVFVGSYLSLLRALFFCFFCCACAAPFQPRFHETIVGPSGPARFGMLRLACGGIGHVVGMTAGNEWMLCEELQALPACHRSHAGGVGRPFFEGWLCPESETKNQKTQDRTVER